jgi:hypothetical protein
MTETLKAGMVIRQTHGRPQNIGRVGTIQRVCGDVIGSAGDVLLVVNDASGAEFTCYDRQAAQV